MAGIEALPGEDAVETAQRVNIKSMSQLWYRAIPYFKFVAVNGSQGYSYDLDKPMHPTRSAMLIAREADRESQKQLETIEGAHANSTVDNCES